ncbi:peptidylprolyl isomerase [Sphingomonas sp. SUN019]|uniref:peptidylprolyl isomerase n=1 Tax=Sphingomonas sp. SUN019 TaxID=2937788 RepID=UPI0021642552|nr:peptidylprolyl isomerase [Sphingomonas sp. SUN019]
MLGFFRRMVGSKFGGLIAFAILGVIALAFAAGDITGLRGSGSGGGATGSAVATVGKEKVTSTELTSRVQDELNGARQQQPTLDIAQFVSMGAVEGVLDRIVNGLALQSFGEAQGMAVSPALIGSQLQAIPALQGPTGKFDQAIYERILAQRKLTDAQVQDDIARETMAQFLIAPTVGASQVPAGMALPYASLLLEKRAGQVAFILTAAMGAGVTPTAQELQTWYTRNIARYTVPERRVIHYARVTADQVKAAPTETEIAQAYAANRARFAPSERRTIAQVTVLDQKAADALAAKVKSGTSIADAARAAGLEARTISSVDKAAYTRQASQPLADAAFSAAQGAVVGPVRGAIGFVVAKIDKIEQVPGKTLDQARAELTGEVAAQKTTESLGRIRDALDDAIGDNANFNELVKDQKLTPVTTPALLATGQNPDDPAARPDPALTQPLAAAFAAEEGDSPTIVQLTPDGSFAVVALERIVRSAPRPLAQVRDDVARDFTVDRARRGAQTVARAALTKVNKGMPLATALAETKLRTPAVRPLAASRAQLSANPQGVDPTLALLFSMAGGTAKMLEAPNNQGWLLVKLNQITPGDAAKIPGVINATRGDLGRVIGREYVQQFSEAVKAELKVSRNPDAVASVKAQLTGQGGSNP